MFRRPPSTTSADTLFPYTTRVRAADAGGRPGRVIVDAVDDLRRTVRQEARHRADHLVVDALTVGGGQRVANLRIALHRVDEEDAVVEALPEQAARVLVGLCGMRPKSRLKIGISEQKTTDMVEVARLAGQAE